ALNKDAAVLVAVDAHFLAAVDLEDYRAVTSGVPSVAGALHAGVQDHVPAMAKVWCAAAKCDAAARAAAFAARSRRECDRAAASPPVPRRQCVRAAGPVKRPRAAGNGDIASGEVIGSARAGCDVRAAARIAAAIRRGNSHILTRSIGS